MTVDNHMKQLMKDLGNAIARAMASSSEIGEAMQRLRQQGYSLYLVCDQKESTDQSTKIELGAPQQQPAHEAVFRLGQEDVSLLRTLGIDATRSSRRRRSS